jgi:hypothetical protein
MAAGGSSSDELADMRSKGGEEEETSGGPGEWIQVPTNSLIRKTWPCIL